MYDPLRILETLTAAIDARNGGRLHAVEAMSLEMGRLLRWSEQELGDLRLAALLHDAGELAALRAFAGEQGNVAAHCAIGSAMASRMGLPDTVAEMVRAHHERWDGGGYPDALRGNAIPTGARILAVADCLATAEFPEALKGLRSGSGAAFDPALVQLVLEHGATLESAAGQGSRAEFETAIAAAGRQDAALWRLVAELGNSLSLHETLTTFDATLGLLVDYGCMVVSSPANDAAGTPWYLSGDESLLRRNGARLTLPLEIAGEPVALLRLYHDRPGAFDDGDRRLLDAIRGKLAAAVHNARRNERCEQLAEVDDLTALPNSRYLFHRLDAELSRCRRNRSTLAVLVCDVSAWPLASYPAIAAGLRRVCREDDCVARVGDGFALVLSGFGRRDLREKESLIATAIAESAGEDIERTWLRLKIGAGFYPDDGSTAEDLLAAADLMLQGA